MTEGRVIGIVSGKGGVGKTSMCVNLGIALREFGKEVTVVDTDFSASNIGVHLGRYDHPVKIQDVLEKGADPASAVFRHPTGIKALVSSNEIHRVEPDLTNMKKVVDHASENSDFVLVDCPPGIDTTVESIMAACDELLIVTMPTQSSSTNAAQVIEKAKQLRKPVLGTVVNMSEDDPERELVDREVEMMTESHIVAKVPHDPSMKESLFDNQPIVLNDPLSDASLEIKSLAADLAGEHFEPPAFPKLKRGINRLKESFTNT